MKTTIPTKDFQRLEKLTERTYFFRFDAAEDTEGGTVTASEETIHVATQTTYGELVTTLIRCKYSLDEELALAANMRTEAEAHAVEDAEFQQWREYCKEVARAYFDTQAAEPPATEQGEPQADGQGEPQATEQKEEDEGAMI